MKFRELLESPVGLVGRTGIKDAEDHITDELKKSFIKIVKSLGGKTVARMLLNNLGAPEEETIGDFFRNPKINEAELSPLQKEYQAYFTGLLKKYDVESPAEMDEETMKKFFNDVTSGWIKGQGKK